MSGGSPSPAAREAVVTADNWLTALRTARKQLGEDGAVPPGASCVMSAAGEVTILDSAQRRRYQLTRVESAAGFAEVTEPKPAEPVLAVREWQPPPGNRGGQLPLASASPGSGASPAAEQRGFVPARPPSQPPANEHGKGLTSLPASAPLPGRVASKRAPTLAYMPDAEERAALGSAQLAPGSDAVPRANLSKPSSPPAAVPATGPVSPTGPSLAAPPPAPANAAVLVPPPAASSASRRKQTLAYSPEESAAVRAQLQSRVASSASELQRPQVSAAPHEEALRLAPAEPVAETHSVMVTLSRRDEEPGPDSPLIYRERSYYWPPPLVRVEVERALREELAQLKHALDPAPRGKFVNLAVFDHVFRDKPEYAPVATLEWKDWRGEPILHWLSDSHPAWPAPPPPAVSGPSPAAAFFAASPPAPAPVAQRPFHDVFAPLPPARTEPALVAAAPASALAPQQPAPLRADAGLAAPGAQAAPLPFAAASTTELGAQPAGAATPTRPANRSADPIHATGDNTGEQDKRLAIAFEAAQDLYFLATPADGLDFAVKLLQELVPCEAVSGCLYDINTDEFRFVAVTGPGAAERKAAAIPSTLGLFSAAVRSGRDYMVVADVMNESRFDPDADGRNGLVANNMALLPLHKADQLFGMLQLINRRNPRGFSDSDMAVGSYVAEQVTQFLREKRGLGRSRA